MVGRSAECDEEPAVVQPGGLPGHSVVSFRQAHASRTYTNLYAADATTGDEERAFETDNDVGSQPAVKDDTVYVGNNDDNLYVVETDGTEPDTARGIPSSSGAGEGTSSVGGPGFGTAVGVAGVGGVVFVPRDDEE
ncbi:PQQ-binding-like beta-propeller repeat protein [Halobaculum sp. MBLA0143]|uniref:PQQ-binding-like beta-propeller repeat protein n=1 Tax=Halobaculum sp. MBLA0143 TaxID=3079933 RepID=UPI003524CC75